MLIIHAMFEHDGNTRVEYGHKVIVATDNIGLAVLFIIHFTYV